MHGIRLAMIKCLSSFTRNSNFLSSAGFKVISSGVRCIILIYTADNQIRTLKFDNITASVAENSPPQKTYDCYLQEDEATITTIITSSANTFGLLADGRMFYFVSYRTVEIIPNLKNVRAICQSDNGFAVIRNSSSVVVFIELYSDRGSNEMLKKYKKIPISWQEERWCFERDTEKSVIHLVRLNVEAVKELFHKFLHQIDPEDTQSATYGKVVVFSINCALFCVFYENAKDAHSEVVPIRTFLSPVDSVQVFSSGIMCVVLASGVIELLFVDKDGKLKGDSIFLGLDEIYAMETIPADECVYFTDKSQLVKVTFNERPAEERSVTWTVDRSMSVTGIIGISYLPTIQAVLCLSENYFVYSIKHEAAATGETKAPAAVIEEGNNDLEMLKKNLLQMTENHQKLQLETDNSTAINVMLYPEALRESCKVILSYKAYSDDYYELPTLADQTSDQLYDICLEFQCGAELKEVFNSPGQWSLEIRIKGVEPPAVECHETIRLDEAFLKRGRVKLFRNCSRNNARLGSEFAINIQGFVESAEKLLVNVPLRVAYDVASIVEVLEEDPLEMKSEGWSKFEIASEDQKIVNRLLDMIIEQRINLEPFVIAIGKSAIVVNVEEYSCAFRCEDPSALQLLKRLLLLEGHNREIFTRIEFAPKETLAVRRDGN